MQGKRRMQCRGEGMRQSLGKKGQKGFQLSAQRLGGLRQCILRVYMGPWFTNVLNITAFKELMLISRGVVSS